MGLQAEAHTKSTVYPEDHEAQRYDYLKLIFLGMSFFLIIGAYSLVKELKNTIFMYTVGYEYIPIARPAALFMLMPAILFYSYLVDRMRRYQLLAFYCFLYAITGIAFAILLGNNQYGLLNMHTSPYRIFGWLFYFFIEGYPAFIVSIFWAFANSISSPDNAKKYYGYMVSFSKLGGMLTAAIAWFLLRARTIDGARLYSDTTNHQILLMIASLFLLVVPFILLIMRRVIPNKYLHGYEAAYKVEQQKQRAGEAKTGVFVGLKMLFNYPYVLGIFGMAFFYDLISVVLSYISVGIAQSTSTDISEVSEKFFEIVFKAHLLGFFISFFVTGFLLRILGIRWSLLLVPATAAVVIAHYMLNYSAMNAIVIAIVALRAIHYSFSNPVRESLYIPTVKEINFKARSWGDSFGSKVAKTAASMFNLMAADIGSALFFTTYSVFFASSVGLWLITAYFVGRRFDQAVAQNEVIGAE